MGPSPTYHPPEGEECETSVEHGLPLWAEPAVGYCWRRPRPSPMLGSRFVGAREVGPWVGEQKPLGKSPLRRNPSPESTYLPTIGGDPDVPALDVLADSSEYKVYNGLVEAVAWGGQVLEGFDAELGPAPL